METAMSWQLIWKRIDFGCLMMSEPSCQAAFDVNPNPNPSFFWEGCKQQPRQWLQNCCGKLPPKGFVWRSHSRKFLARFQVGDVQIVYIDSQSLSQQIWQTSLKTRAKSRVPSIPCSSMRLLVAIEAGVTTWHVLNLMLLLGWFIMIHRPFLTWFHQLITRKIPNSLRQGLNTLHLAG